MTAAPTSGPPATGLSTSEPAPLPGDDRLRAAGAFRCSLAARDRQDPFFATAPPARRWLLVEHPGPWGFQALTGAGYDEATLAGVEAFCRNPGARFQLIRRTAARGAPTESGGRFAVVDCSVGVETVRWGRVDSPQDLPAALADLDASTTPSDEPVFLVCTHGRHDACCAVRGRPVAAVLAAAHPERTWETTHTGGDRFAANAILLPHGLVLGQLAPEEALDVAAGYEAGRVDPRLMRGRAGLSPAVQGAQHHARLAYDEQDVDAFAPRGAEQGEDGCWTVRLDGGERGELRVVVRERWFPAPTPLTCSARGAASMRTFDLVSSDVSAAVGRSSPAA